MACPPSADEDDGFHERKGKKKVKLALIRHHTTQTYE
jgi:hypothetical protein